MGVGCRSAYVAAFMPWHCAKQCSKRWVATDLGSAKRAWWQSQLERCCTAASCAGPDGVLHATLAQKLAGQSAAEAYPCDASRSELKFDVIHADRGGLLSSLLIAVVLLCSHSTL